MDARTERRETTLEVRRIIPKRRLIVLREVETGYMVLRRMTADAIARNRG